MRKFKLVDVSNKESFGSNYIGEVGIFSYHGSGFTFNTMSSSSVIRLTRDIKTKRLTVETRNTTYIFDVYEED